MKRIILVVAKVLFILIALYGILCLVGEADPWTFGAQVRLFIQGVVLFGIGFLGCVFIDWRFDKA